jgi:hypothetical protein
VRENLAYAKKVKEALETGASPGDFPREDYEKTWQDRFTVNDLNIHGKRALGMVLTVIQPFPLNGGASFPLTYPPYRFPHGQRAVKQQRPYRRVRAHQPLLEHMYRFRSQLITRNMHRRQRHILNRRQVKAVNAHHRDILRHAQPVLL